VTPGRRPAGRRSRASAPPVALTTDAWYTLLYIRSSERLALAARRRRIWSEPLVRHGLGRARALELLARRDRWARLLESRGRTPNIREQLRTLHRWTGAPVDVEEMVTRLDATLLACPVLLAPGAAKAVRRLDDLGVPLAVVSNVLNESGHAARTVLDRLGVLTRFRAVVLSCEHPFAKPAPGPFLLATRFLGVRPAEAVHLGDLGYDVLGARRAGMRAWWYVGLRRLNGYLPGQVDPGTVSRRETVRAWSEIPGRFDGAAVAGSR
jgi:FMN phosphatase YigB (HAD superfamily)